MSKWRDQRDEFKDAGKPFKELYHTLGKLEFEAETFKNLIDGRLLGP